MSLRRITDLDTPEIVDADSGGTVTYERTDQAPVDFKIAGNKAAETPFRLVNYSPNPFVLNLAVMSSIFQDGAAGQVSSISVAAGQAISFMFDGQYPWIVMAKN